MGIVPIENSNQPNEGGGGSTLNLSLNLSNQQQAVFEALNELDLQTAQTHKLSSMYLGALRVISDKSNLDRFPQAAHSIRELMEKLPRWFNIPTKAQNESLKNKVIEIENRYSGVLKQTKNYSDNGEWAGNIDMPLKKFLASVGDFFKWFESHSPRRKAEQREMLNSLDVAGRKLPEPLAKHEVEGWNLLMGYFNSITHHGRLGEENEFLLYLEELEKIILDKRKPQTSNDLNKIDEIIEKGNSNA